MNTNLLDKNGDFCVIRLVRCNGGETIICDFPRKTLIDYKKFIEFLSILWGYEEDWYIIPEYDVAIKRGKFHVTIYIKNPETGIFVE